MDSLFRIGSFFPTGTITVYWVISNIVINDVSSCSRAQHDLVIALMVLFAILHAMCCFTDSFLSADGTRMTVLMIPLYGPVCVTLAEEYERDRVYEYFSLKGRDYVHALLSTTAFVLIMLFTNPVSMCLFPSGDDDGTTRFNDAIVRAVPIIVAIITAMLMVCLGTPRQIFGKLQNVPETCPPPERPVQFGDNPMFNKFPAMGGGGPDDHSVDEESVSLDASAFAPPARPYGPPSVASRQPSNLPLSRQPSGMGMSMALGMGPGMGPGMSPHRSPSPSEAGFAQHGPRPRSPPPRSPGDVTLQMQMGQMGRQGM